MIVVSDEVEVIQVLDRDPKPWLGFFFLLVTFAINFIVVLYSLWYYLTNGLETGFSVEAVILSFIMGVINTIPSLITIRIKGMENYTGEIRDYMWWSVFNPFAILLRFFVFAVIYLVMDIALFLVGAIFIGFVTKFVFSMINAPDLVFIIFGEGVVVFLLLLGYTFSLRRNRHRQEEASGTSELSYKFRSKVTSATNRFVGLESGEVYVIDAGVILKVRSSPIVQIFDRHPYLIVEDMNGDLFMWKREGDKWSYVGHLRWIDDKTITFSNETGRRRKIKRVVCGNNHLAIQTAYDIYVTDIIDETMKVERKEYDIFDTISFTVSEGGICFLKKSRDYIYVLESERDIATIDRIEDVVETKSIYFKDSLWVILGNNIYQHDSASLKQLQKTTLPGSITSKYRFIREELAVLYTPLGKSHSFLIADVSSNKQYKIIYWMTPLYFDGKALHVSVGNAYFKINIEHLETIEQ